MSYAKKLMFCAAVLGISSSSFGNPADGIKSELTLKFQSMIDSGQYMRSSDCKPSTERFPGWESLPVQECSYTSHQMKIEVSTTAFLLFPSAEQLATWTVNACIDAGTKNLRTCAGRLGNRIWTASAGQFPVAGFVVEPPMGKGWLHPDQPYCYLFRDGVTVTTASWSDTQVHLNHRCGEGSVNTEPVKKAKLYGRLSSVTRGSFKLSNKTVDVGTDAMSSPQWATVVGIEFRKAWSSDRNFLFLATVKGDLSASDGSIWDRH